MGEDRHARAAHARWRTTTPDERVLATAPARTVCAWRDRDEALRRLAEEAGHSGPFASDLVDELVAEIRRERMTALAQRSVAARAARRAA
jgi:hypothetical protein